MRENVAFDGLDFSRRAELTELMDEPCSRDELRACLCDLAKVNGWFLGYRPVLAFLDDVAGRAGDEELRIVDVGCGYGDGLRRMERWARAQGVRVKLTGVDLNPDAIAIAAEATPRDSGIQWVAADIFDFKMSRPAHVIVSSLFTHHLPDEDVVRFVEWMERNAQAGWLVNDLERARAPYHLFGWFAKVAGLHRFVQHDGPVSFLRAFVADDWRRLCTAAGLKAGDYEVAGYRPARLCVRRRKPQR